MFFFFFFNDTATTEIYTLSLHDALPILISTEPWLSSAVVNTSLLRVGIVVFRSISFVITPPLVSMPKERGVTSRSRTSLTRSEEHTSELQSRQYLVCRLLLEKKKTIVLV